MGSLISADRAKQLAEAARARGTGANHIPYGVHLMRIISVEAVKNKNGADAIACTYKDVADAYDPIIDRTTIGNDVSEQILAGRLLHGAGIDIAPAETINDLCKQIQKALGNKPIQVAVQHQQQLWKKDDGSILKTI